MRISAMTWVLVLGCLLGQPGSSGAGPGRGHGGPRARAIDAAGGPRARAIDAAGGPRARAIDAAGGPRARAGDVASGARAWAGAAAAPTDDSFAGLQRRIATDLKAGRPLVATVHVALCDNRTIWCGSKRLGSGDDPTTNLYWGGAAGLRAWFDHRPGWVRVLRGPGDGKSVLERVVYRRRVKAPGPAWRRLGVRGPFDVYLVGLGYRGLEIGQATRAFLEQVAGEAEETVVLADGTRLAAGGASHLVGYAGHNHLMDAPSLAQPAFTRRAPVGWFALACISNSYFGPRLGRGPAQALLVTKVLMYPGAFTLEGILKGLVEGRSPVGIFKAGADLYARHQKHSPSQARAFFTHGGRPDFNRFVEPAPGGKGARAPQRSGRARVEE